MQEIMQDLPQAKSQDDQKAGIEDQLIEKERQGIDQREKRA